MTGLRLFIRLLPLACFLVLQDGLAQTATCTITAHPMSFSGYDGRTAVTSNPTIDISCSGSNQAGKNVSVTLSASAGNGTIAARTMVNGTSRLNYNMYLDSGHTIVFGDGTTGSTATATTGNNKQASVPIYGNIPAGQNLAPATYTSTVVITATY